MTWNMMKGMQFYIKYNLPKLIITFLPKQANRNVKDYRLYNNFTILSVFT